MTSKYKRIFLINDRRNDEEFELPFINAAREHQVPCTRVNPQALQFRYDRLSNTIEVYDGNRLLDLSPSDFVYIRRTSTAKAIASLLVYVLESMGVPFNDRVSRLRDSIHYSKLSQAFYLRDIVASPSSWVTTPAGFNANADAILESLTFPVVFKTDGANGKCVWKVETPELLRDRIITTKLEKEKGIQKLFTIQELIPNAFDIRVVVYQKKVLASIARISTDGFHNNISQGGTAEHITLTEEEEHIALRTAEKLGLDLAGVDIVRSTDGPLLFEVNRSPGVVNGIVKDSVVRKIVAMTLDSARN